LGAGQPSSLGAVSPLNSRPKWSAPGEHYSVALSGKNLLAQKYFHQVGGTAFGDLVTAAPGRSYGINVEFDF
jgi:outer membrane receptor protein involved in Fe transport